VKIRIRRERLTSCVLLLPLSHEVGAGVGRN
jgi:hypothetical protein